MSNPFVGEIRPFGFPFAPRGWAFCNGQSLPIGQNQALFSLLGTTYGGNGVQNFNLPDLRGRTPLHFGQGPGLGSYAQGQIIGQEGVTLLATQLPAHGHTLMGTTATGTRRTVRDSYFAADSRDDVQYYSGATDLTTVAPATIASAGGNQAHPNMQPYLVINYCIALQGIFPSRN